MYKVFINDNEVQFLANDNRVPDNSIELDGKLTPHEVIGKVIQAQKTEHGNFYILSAKPRKRFERFIESFPLIRAAGGVVRKNNLWGPVLMIFRKGRWDLPKGKIDEGEGRQAAALREVREECGIRQLEIVSKLHNTFHIYQMKNTWVVKCTYWYLMKSTDSGMLKPQEAEGIIDVKWISENEVHSLLPFSYASISDLMLTGVLGH